MASLPVTTRIVLASRPSGKPVAANFRVEQETLRDLAEGEVLLQILYLSLDPYMRGRMDDAKSYAKPVEIGDVMEGGTVARVVSSRNATFKPGDIVLSHSGWQSYAISDGTALRKLDPEAAPITTALGILGMPGFTAYAGLRNIGKPKAGETLVVAAASGAVGSAVGQIARIFGARAVGIAGGREKCEYVREELGFDAVVDHRSDDFAAELAAACPKGIDVYFENVGGHVWSAVFPLLNDFARVPVCGLIAHYNETASASSGHDQLPVVMRAILRKSLTIRGFIQREFADQRPDFYREAGTWIADGRLKYKEDIVDGLENAPSAFFGLLEGRNFGKLIVRVAS
ncbi:MULTISPECIES: NADP-dependent oxidoreductase [unclassified Rhizobium]|uniref:NADP-dependent oxidoreductase n=1 Tax=unclassified Rhizobium TaxID=2613769 RepID=UPI000CDF50B5|nr:MULTISPECIES: NADP-dependent oxidoreductase [Rhizobium]AVA24525.1 Zn-dependent alcohol dehydrogenase GroES-like protein [Rhizobium sp. NXC24]MDK4742168.1 NADP-dependent oxidoreductase [Rhizobium sp. CNPSo 3464]UWU24442.1 NADP-dependent oxidoreductase [Rhizobium tropici]